MVRSDDRMIIPSENDLKACVSSLKCEKMDRNRGYQKLVIGKFHTHKLVSSPLNDGKNMTWHGRSRMKILVKIYEHAWAVLLRIYGLNPKHIKIMENPEISLSSQFCLRKEEF